MSPMTNEKFRGNRKNNLEKLKEKLASLLSYRICRSDTEPDPAAAPRHAAATEEGTGTAGAARAGAPESQGGNSVEKLKSQLSFQLSFELSFFIPHSTKKTQ